MPLTLTTFLFVLLATFPADIIAFGVTPHADPPITDPGTPCMDPADFMPDNTFWVPGGPTGVTLTCGYYAAEGHGAGPTGKIPMTERTCTNSDETINQIAGYCCSGGEASSRCS